MMPYRSYRAMSDDDVQALVAKVQDEYVVLYGGPDNTPLDPIGSKTSGDAFANRIHLDF